MIWPGSKQFHPTMVTVMGQVNQALTGYGAVSVYGPQIFELLGLGVTKSEYLTMGNYVSYFFLMTFAWLLIDRVGRRILMVGGAFGIAACFLILTLLGGLAQNTDKLGLDDYPIAVVGGIVLFIATGTFGIGWLSQVWLIPTEIYPSTSRAQGAAISVVIWGLANFAVTLLTPIGFNNLSYWLFLVFAATNLFAGWWTWVRILNSPSLDRLTQLSRHTVRKQEAGPLKKIRLSLMTRKTREHGLSPGSITDRIGACLRRRKRTVKTARVSLYLATDRE